MPVVHLSQDFPSSQQPPYTMHTSVAAQTLQPQSGQTLTRLWGELCYNPGLVPGLFLPGLAHPTLPNDEDFQGGQNIFLHPFGFAQHNTAHSR